MDSSLKKRITDAGVAALGLALIMKPLGEFPSLIALAVFGVVGDSVNSSFLLPALIACIAAIVGGVVLMRRSVSRTGGWFVAAILTWLCVDLLFSGLDPWVSTLLVFVITWFELYVNAAPVAVAEVPIAPPAPVEEMNLIKTETPLSPVEEAIASTDAQPLDAASVAPALNVGPGNRLLSALGLVGAIFGVQFIGLGLMNATFAAFDRLGDSFSGLPPSAAQSADGSNYQIIFGVILLGVGLTMYTLYKPRKK